MKFRQIALGLFFLWISNPMVLGNPPKCEIIIDHSDWGLASKDEVFLVLQSSCDQLLNKNNLLNGATIVVSSTNSSPVCHAQTNASHSHAIKINARDRYWCRYVFQFAHELGHVLCGTTNGSWVHQWFEESLCEAISLYVLEEVGREWMTSPPYPEWKDYARAFRSYAENRVREQSYPENFQLDWWWQENFRTLIKNPRMRKENLWVAMKLLPVIRQDAINAWAACAWLNHGNELREQSFQNYLQNWCYACKNDEQRRFVSEIANLFGFSITRN